MSRNEISVMELKKMIEKGLPGDCVLVDVRTEGEYAEGRVDCSVNMPPMELETNFEKLKKYRNVYLICYSGGRSAFTAMQLRMRGINAFNVTGGLLSWLSQGYSLSK